MTVSLAPDPVFQWLQNGVAAAGYQLFTYAAGTMAKQTTYTDSTAGTPNTNPIILDSNGKCSIWIDNSVVYKFVLAPPTDTDPPTNAIWTVDDIGPPAQVRTIASYNLLSTTPTALPYEVTAISGGSGGTGGTLGTYAGSVFSGPEGFEWSVVIGSNGIGTWAIDNPGIATTNAVPTLSLPSGTGLTGATAPAATVGIIPVDTVFGAPTSDGLSIGFWTNAAGSLATVVDGSGNQLTVPRSAALTNAVSNVNAAGAAQIVLVDAAGSTEVGLVNAAGAAAIADVQGVAASFGLAPSYTTLALMLSGLATNNSGTILQPSGLYIDTYTKISSTALTQVTTSAFGIAGQAVETRIILENSVITPWPIVPDFEINPEDAAKFLNEMIPNRHATLPTRDLYQRVDIMIASGATTLTQAYSTDPTYGPLTRAQIGTSGDVALFQTVTAAPSSTGNYRVRFEVESTPGAGSQTFGVSNTSTGGTTFTVAEGTFTTVDLTFTGMVNNSQIFITRNGADADIVFSKPQVTLIQVEPSATPSVICRDGLIGNQNLLVQNSIPLGTGPSIISPFKGRVLLSVGSYAAMTLMLAIKQTGAGTSVASPIVAKTPNNVIELGAASAGTFALCPGFAAGGPSIQGLGWQVVAFRFGASESGGFLGSVPFLNPATGAFYTGTGTGGTPLALTEIYHGGAGYEDLNPLVGEVGVLAGWYSELTDAQLAQSVKHINDSLRLGSYTVPGTIVVGEGDSITVGVNANNGSYLTQGAAALKVPLFSFAVTGSAFTNMQARLPSVLRAITNATNAGFRVIFSAMIGTNGPIPAIADVQTYVNTLKAVNPALVEILWCTVTTNQSSAYDTYFAGIRALSNIAGVVDFALNSNLYGPNVESNATYFTGIHPTTLSQNTIMLPDWTALATPLII